MQVNKGKILNVITGEQLDALIAELIMEYEWIDYKWYDGTIKKLLWKGNEIPTGDDFGRLYDDNDLLYPWDMPNYSNDISAAWKVFKKIKTMLFSKRRKFMKNIQIITSKKELSSGNLIAYPDVFWFITPESICRAALLTVLEVDDNAS